MLVFVTAYVDGIPPKGPYPPCLRMADRALLAGYPRYVLVYAPLFLQSGFRMPQGYELIPKSDCLDKYIHSD